MKNASVANATKPQAKRAPSLLLTYLPLADGYLYEPESLPHKRIIRPEIERVVEEKAREIRGALGEGAAIRVTSARKLNAEAEGMVDLAMYDIAMHMTILGEVQNLAAESRVIIASNPDTMQYEYSPMRSILVEEQRGAEMLDSFFCALGSHMQSKYGSTVLRELLVKKDGTYGLKYIRKTKNRKEQMCLSNFLRFPRDFEKSLEAQRVLFPKEINEESVMKFRVWFNKFYLTDRICQSIIKIEKAKYGSSLFERYMLMRPNL